MRSKGRRITVNEDPEGRGADQRKLRVYLTTSGDGRESANPLCWPAQERLERRLTEVLAGMGAEVVRAFPVDPAYGHGFVRTQRMGIDVFSRIPAEAPVVVAIAAWQFKVGS